MILVDTSVWVDHLREGNDRLIELLENDRVCCHPFVIGELAIGNLRNRREILDLMLSLTRCSIMSDEEALIFIERHRLMGQGIGYVDVHLLGSARLSGVKLWTLDLRLAAAAHRLHLD